MGKGKGREEIRQKGGEYKREREKKGTAKGEGVDGRVIVSMDGRGIRGRAAALTMT